MRLRLRLLWLILSSLWRPRMGVLDESVLAFRVLPNDVDVRNATSDRFVALMDLGRMDIAFRVGLLGTMVRNRWVPLATFVTIRFRHHLRLFERYNLRTRILYWDESTFYFEQRFERGGRTLATGYVCATMLGPGGPVPPQDVLAPTGQSPDRPAKPPIVAELQEQEVRIHALQQTREHAAAIQEYR
jgi:acyl-CoA thioesterase FadM